MSEASGQFDTEDYGDPEYDEAEHYYTADTQESDNGNQLFEGGGASTIDIR